MIINSKILFILLLCLISCSKSENGEFESYLTNCINVALEEYSFLQKIDLKVNNCDSVSILCKRHLEELMPNNYKLLSAEIGIVQEYIDVSTKIIESQNNYICGYYLLNKGDYPKFGNSEIYFLDNVTFKNKVVVSIKIKHLNKVIIFNDNKYSGVISLNVVKNNKIKLSLIFLISTEIELSKSLELSVENVLKKYNI